MSEMKQTVLRFVLKFTGSPMEIMARFNPKGKTVLNRTEWRGKEPRSCAVTSVHFRSHSAASEEPIIYEVEVTYRPKGCIVYSGNTKYDGWMAMVLDRKKDGTLLDGHGQPLPEGQPAVYLRYEVYEDVDFNEIDFGDFVGEFEVEGIKHVEFDDVLRQLHESRSFSASITSTFVAPRRQRPMVKIILSNDPSGTGMDGFGTRIVNVNKFTPQLQQVLLDQLTELVSGFVEGRYSIKNMSNGDFVFAELGDVLVDCAPNEEGKESRFNCLSEYVPDTFLEDLAKRLMATYEVEVSVVDGTKNGLLLRTLDVSKPG
jgi:hypothetical protein